MNSIALNSLGFRIFTVCRLLISFGVGSKPKFTARSVIKDSKICYYYRKRNYTLIFETDMIVQGAAEIVKHFKIEVTCFSARV